MSTASRESVQTKSILVFRALMVGDMLCAIPAVRNLRAAYPAARITLAGLAWARELLDCYPQYFDDFIAFPGFPGLHETAPQPAAYRSFIAQCRARRFDAAVQLHGDGRLTNGIVQRIGARMTYGFHPVGADNPDPRRFIPWPEQGHEIHRLLKLTEFMELPGRGDRLEFPLSESDGLGFFHRSDTRALRAGGYACLHPGARLASRRWPAARFARVADALHDMGYAVVLTGAAGEHPVTEEVVARMHATAHNFCGRTSLREAAALLSRARLLVCNDTGISHLAAAVGTPSVVMVMGSDPARWAPVDRGHHRSLHHPVDCRPCNYDVCPIDHRCATAISVAEVTAAVRRLATRRGTVAARPIDLFSLQQKSPSCGHYES